MIKFLLIEFIPIATICVLIILSGINKRSETLVFMGVLGLILTIISLFLEVRVGRLMQKIEKEENKMQEMLQELMAKMVGGLDPKDVERLKKREDFWNEIKEQSDLQYKWSEGYSAFRVDLKREGRPNDGAKKGVVFESGERMSFFTDAEMRKLHSWIEKNIPVMKSVPRETSEEGK